MRVVVVAVIQITAKLTMLTSSNVDVNVVIPHYIGDVFDEVGDISLLVNGIVRSLKTQKNDVF